jgi:hypothetical protein
MPGLSGWSLDMCPPPASLASLSTTSYAIYRSAWKENSRNFTTPSSAYATRKIRHLADVSFLTSLVCYPRDVERGGVFALRSSPTYRAGARESEQPC